MKPRTTSVYLTEATQEKLHEASWGVSQALKWGLDVALALRGWGAEQQSVFQRLAARGAKDGYVVLGLSPGAHTAAHGEQGRIIVRLDTLELDHLGLIFDDPTGHTWFVPYSKIVYLRAVHQFSEWLDDPVETAIPDQDV